MSNGAAMNLNRLRIFHSAARLLNFTRSAEELHLTQPGISKHLKALEDYYGAQLFDRLGKKVALTQAGEALLEATEAAFGLLDRAKMRIDDLNGLCAGKLAIGASVTIGAYILPEKLVQYRQSHPGVEIKVETSLSRQITGKVLNNHLELGLVGHYEPDERLAVRPFLKDRLVLIVSPRHQWAQRAGGVTMQKLTDETLLFSNRRSGTGRLVQALLDGERVIPRETIEIGTTEGVKKAVAANLGVALLSRHVLGQDLSSGAVIEVPIAGGEASRDLFLVHHKDKYLSRAARAFIEILG